MNALFSESGTLASEVLNTFVSTWQQCRFTSYLSLLLDKCNAAIKTIELHLQHTIHYGRTILEQCPCLTGYTVNHDKDSHVTEGAQGRHSLIYRLLAKQFLVLTLTLTAYPTWMSP
ncbi:hypothetical protein V6N13_043113 [Hibiscus sabdariffa]